MLHFTEFIIIKRHISKEVLPNNIIAFNSFLEPKKVLQNGGET